VQPIASLRPAIVNKSWTPESDLKRASCTGPSAVTKNGITFDAPMSFASATCGFGPTFGKISALGDVPPMFGCE
jgi:hypothetical protein